MFLLPELTPITFWEHFS